MQRRAFVIRSSAALALPVLLGGRASAIFAQSGPAAYPTKPVKIIAPVAPGGGVDLVARTIADRLQKTLGGTFIVDNMAGGGGVIASLAVARATPDGTTLMVGYVATHGTNPAVRKLPFDTQKDFSPIAMVGGTPNVLVVPATLNLRSLNAFLEHARANPGKLSYGSAGVGSLTHLAMEQLKLAANFFSVHVAYRGIGPALTDLMGGQTQSAFPGLAAALPHIKGGRLVPLAVTGLKRHALLPNVPTFEESGFRDFTGVQWYGIVGPAGIPADIIVKLNTAINQNLAMPDLAERLSGEALEPMPMSPEAFGKYMSADVARWKKLATERKITLDD